MLDMLVDEFSEDLDDIGITLLPSIAELVFRLKQKYIDLKYIKVDGHTVLYLSKVIDLDYYHEFINNIKSGTNKKDSELLLLLKDFIKLSRRNGTSVEDEIEKFYN